MKAIYARLKNRFEFKEILAGISCLIISLTVFFIIKILNREIPL